MKAIIIGDIHLSLYSQDRIIQGMTERLFYLNKVLRNIVAYAIENGIKYIIIAGDVFHTKSIIHSLAQSILLDFVRDFPEIMFIIIDGNHDMSSKSGTGVSALKCLDREDNVNMIHKPLVLDNIYFVPWNAQTMIDDVKQNSAPYLVSHFGLNEAMLNSGISIVSDIKLKDLVKYKKCFISHYHMPQEIDNVWIPGSIIQLDWGEKGEEKRFLIFDSDNNTVESIPTEGYKKHIEINLETEDKDELKQLFTNARKLKKEGHAVKFNRLQEGADITDIEGDFLVVDKVEKDITNRGIDTSMSKEDMLKRYLEIKKIPEDQMEFYLNIGKEIINESGV